MTQKLINTGTSANKGDGDPLRLAFEKINDNFTELYTGSPIVPQDLRGSVFGDDSTLLVDGVNSKIVGPIESTSILPGDGTTDIGSTSNRFYNAWFTGQVETDSVLANIFYGPLTGNVTGDVTGDVSGTAGAVAFSGITGKPTTLAGYGITDAMVSGAAYDGDITGSVFGDDSTLLVDGVNNKIVGPVDTASVDAVSLRTSATSIALGSNAGKTNQANLAVAIGTNAGETGQSLWAVAVGTGAGSINQGMQSVAVGNNAGLNEQGQDATAIGQSAGAEYQGHDTVAVGAAAGAFGQEQGAVAVGYSAAPGNLLVPSYVSGGTGGAALVVDDTTGIYPGFRVRGTGFTTQTVVSVDSGTTLTLSANASQTPTNDMFFLGGQGTDAIAIGKDAAAIQQSTSAIAIGKDAGKTTQGANAIAIGKESGVSNQGANAIAIGEKAGYANQAANSIVINATGAEVYNFGANSTIITPIRNDTMVTILGYDADTGQVTHNAAIPGYTNTADLKVLVAASADFADFQTRIAAL